MPMFQAHNISMQITNGRWLFKDISFELEEGKILILRGPSGCGYAKKKVKSHSLTK